LVLWNVHLDIDHPKYEHGRRLLKRLQEELDIDAVRCETLMDKEVTKLKAKMEIEAHIVYY
jgi:hypothetical protein